MDKRTFPLLKILPVSLIYVRHIVVHTKRGIVMVKYKVNGEWVQPNTAMTIYNSEKDNVIKRIQTHQVGIIKPPLPEAQGVIRELNSDEQDFNTKMSSIDMRSRLTNSEQLALTVLDSSVLIGAMPSYCLNISRQYKRTTVSIEGKGREEAVQMAVGIRKDKSKKGMFGRVWDAIRNKEKEVPE